LGIKTLACTKKYAQYSSDTAADVQISVEIWDKTLGSRLDSRTILDASAGFIN